MPPADDLAERLARLEHRVAALEAPGGPPADRGAPDPDTFWALAGLRARSEPPGAVLVAGSVTLPGNRVARWQETVPGPELLAAEWEDHADVLGALGHPVRLRLLHQVLTGNDAVPGLVGLEGMGTTGQVYHHLRQLVAVGWLRAVGGGRYEVPAARVVPLLASILAARR